MAKTNVYRQMIESKGGFVFFGMGMSMRPLIQPDTVYVGVVKVGRLEKGDIILFEKNRGEGTVYVLHRIVKIKGDGIYITRGDNNSEGEEVSADSIIGAVDRIFWTKDASKFMPRLLGAERDGNGGYSVSVTSARYRLYSRVWTAILPLRRIYYRWRAIGGLRGCVAKMPFARRVYHFFKNRLS